MTADTALEIAKRVAPTLTFGEQTAVALELIRAFHAGVREEMKFTRQLLGLDK
jgi:hypothetical protein